MATLRRQTRGSDLVDKHEDRLAGFCLAGGTVAQGASNRCYGGARAGGRSGGGDYIAAPRRSNAGAPSVLPSPRVAGNVGGRVGSGRGMMRELRLVLLGLAAVIALLLGGTFLLRAIKGPPLATVATGETAGRHARAVADPAPRCPPSLGPGARRNRARHRRRAGLHPLLRSAAPRLPEPNMTRSSTASPPPTPAARRSIRTW